MECTSTLADNHQPSALPISVSFVIPHKGRETLLIDTLDSIAQLAITGFNIDVIIVTKNIEPLRALALIPPHLSVQVINASDDVSISTQRNMGVAQVNSTYLAFIDADIQLAPDWLSVVHDCLHKRGAVLVSAHQQAPEDALMLEHIRTSLANAEIDTDVTFLPGRNLFLRTEHFGLVGGFPEHLTTCEDYYFTHAMSQLGVCFYTSSTSYIHLGEDKLLHEMYNKEIWRGQSNIASLQGRKIPLREFPSFIIPPFLLLMACTMLITGVGAWIVNSEILLAIALCAFIGFLLPFGAYCIRLYAMVPKTVSLWDVIQFYAVYFPARAIGTIKGSIHSITTDSHA